MNKKSSRNSPRAPTMQAANHIAPSATLAMDGELPLSASNGVTAPAPLASHDVLQAALAHLPEEASGADAGTTADAAAVTAPVVIVDAPAASVDATPPVEGKKTSKKPAKAVAKASPDGAADDAPAVAPAKPAKVPKIKFVEVTFALPESEAELLDAMKKTHQSNGLALKKGQLLRAGLLALADIDAGRLAQLVAHLPVEPRASKKKK
ncbi:MAG: hypothetical protein M3Y65_17455 [Pseudomonadota bacterium]|nr:hypothetical protein [Pseudomonadota bacterium]